MKPTGIIRSEVEQNGIDRILATEEALIPSSGFLASVMERVREEAAAPAPIPFPWKRALPGMVVVAGVLGAGAVVFVRQALPAMHGFTMSMPPVPAAAEALMKQAGWVALALWASLSSWILSKRLAGRTGLL